MLPSDLCQCQIDFRSNSLIFTRRGGIQLTGLTLTQLCAFSFVICSRVFFVQWIAMRGSCSFCLNGCNSWPSLFKFIFIAAFRLFILLHKTHSIISYPRFENYNNFWLVKTPGIKTPYSRVLLGHITGCN